MSYNDPRGAAMQTRTVEQASAAAHSIRRAQAATSSVFGTASWFGGALRRDRYKAPRRTRESTLRFSAVNTVHNNTVGGGSGRQKP